MTDPLSYWGQIPISLRRIAPQPSGRAVGSANLGSDPKNYFSAVRVGQTKPQANLRALLLQNTKAGKVRALAVGTLARSPALPNVPTVAELGYPGFEAALWLGIMGPANMPKPVVDRLHKEISAIVATAEFKAAMDANGAEPLASKSPEDFREMLRGQVTKFTKITKALDIKLD